MTSLEAINTGFHCQRFDNSINIKREITSYLTSVRLRTLKRLLTRNRNILNNCEQKYLLQDKSAW